MSAGLFPNPPSDPPKLAKLREDYEAAYKAMSGWQHGDPHRKEIYSHFSNAHRRLRNEERRLANERQA